MEGTSACTKWNTFGDMYTFTWSKILRQNFINKRLDSVSVLSLVDEW